VVVIACQGRHQRRVGGQRLHLPALGIEDQLGERVVVDLELEADAVLERTHRLDFGLGRGARAVVGLGRRVGRRALEVVVPVRRPVAVGVDAVDVLGEPAAVDVPQVLAPQARALVDEGVVVAVGVDHRNEPQLTRLQQALDRLVGLVLAVVEDVLEQTALGLGRDPLARVLHGVVEDRRTATVGDVVRALCDLVRHDRLPEDRVADDLLLDHARVLLGELVVEGLEVDVGRRARAGARCGLQAPWPEDVVAVGRLGQRLRRRRQRARGAEWCCHRRALLGQLLRLRRGRDHEELALLARDVGLLHVEPRARESVGVDLAADHVLVERLDCLAALR
jgi:hypothetical protein